ncbi:NUDIX domain-containing protein [candidate division GN15 bacterium]|nr:NUDIX domain-containing protein [candidate division GN15 bacterium]
MRLPIQVAVYCVCRIDNDWRFLLLHRVLKRLSFWQGVTGGVEEGETIDETAQRELTEETGFDIVPKPIGYTYTFPADEFFRDIYETPVDTITQHVFVAILDDCQPPTLDPVEHDAFCWVPFDDALEMLYWWDDRESIQRVRSFIRSHLSRS